MLPINLNIIFYALTNNRGFIVHSNMRPDNLALIANNTLAFSITSKEMNYSSYNFFKKKNYTSLPISYKNLKYKDDISEQTYRAYPIILKLQIQYSNFLSHLIFILNEINISNLIGVQLKRKKTKFTIRILGLVGYLSKYQFLMKYAYIWQNLSKRISIFSYRKLIKIMLVRLQSGLLFDIKQLCTKLNFKIKKKKYFIKKSKKYYFKNLAKPKFSLIFKSTQIN